MDNTLKFKKIKTIKRSKKTQKVYNFNVPRYESYIANGFIVHNCENHVISQNIKSAKVMNPEEIVKIALKHQCESVCMTYNEPSISFEFLIDLANSAHNASLKFVLKTNGYVNREPWAEICRVTDAMNIDYKGTDSQYKEISGVNKSVFFERTKEAFEAGVHIEISVPLYDTFLDDVRSFFVFGSFLESLSREIPCHLLPVYPAYNHIDRSTTSEGILSTAKNILSFYVNNID